jgi:uncharacterized integral membrane protein
VGRYLRVLSALLLLAVAGIGVLFYIQNATRTTQLSLDVGVWAWQLEQPVSVPLLVLASFAVGFLAATVALGMISMRQSSRMRRLEQDLQLSSAITGNRSTTAAQGSKEPGSW